MKTTSMLNELTNAFGLSAKAQLTQQPSGAVNHVYCLRDEGLGNKRALQVHLPAAVKWLGNDDFSGVDRQQQFKLQQALATLGAAPTPIWLNSSETLWVEKWEESSEDALAPQDLARVLYELHQLPVDAPALNLWSRWQHYFDIAKLTKDAPLYQRAMKLKYDVQASEQDLPNLVLCHNDLLRGHVLSASQTPPLIIDWEYAAKGNRYFDIASCCMINRFSAHESDALVTAYAAFLAVPVTEAFDNYCKHVELVSVTNALWNSAMEKDQNPL